MKVIKDKYIKKDDFFKLNRLFDVSKSEIEKDWLIYKDQRNYLFRVPGSRRLECVGRLR